MAIKLGNQEITLRVGSAECRVYLGDVLIESGDTPTPPTPSFDGKWLATYSDSHTESAECDASSAITEGEIMLVDLESVQIGDCVTNIGEEAFYNCTSLTSATIGSGVTSIGSYAFQGCSSLTSVTMPSSLDYIDSYAFRNCSSLTSVTVLAITPPTLSSKVFSSTNNCPIYVPAASVSAYQTASGWSTYASRIQAIP